MRNDQRRHKMRGEIATDEMNNLMHQTVAFRMGFLHFDNCALVIKTSTDRSFRNRVTERQRNGNIKC